VTSGSVLAGVQSAAMTGAFTAVGLKTAAVGAVSIAGDYYWSRSKITAEEFEFFSSVYE